jgi:hypothetical protein
MTTTKGTMNTTPALTNGADDKDTGPPPDPFDPAKLRLPQNFAAAAGVTKLLTTVPVRKPSKEVFVRTHPDESFRIDTAVLELKEDREIYLVMPDLLEALATETTVSPRLLWTSITKQGALFLWPLRLADSTGRLDDWGRSALEAAKAAKDRWTRVTANMSSGCYDVLLAPEGLADPEWPDLGFNKILELAFRDKYITSHDHPVLKKLRGEL